MSTSSKLIGIVDFRCSMCGNNKAYLLSDGTSHFKECTNCGLQEINTTNSGFRSQSSLNIKVKCPYCNSTNTKKISEMSKAASVAVFGVFAMGKVSKQWHCNNCKSDF